MKSGDKVRVRAGFKHEGRTGTVTKDANGSTPVDVEFDDESSSWHSFAEDELEPYDKGL